MSKTKIAAKEEVLGRALNLVSKDSGIRIDRVSVARACLYLNAFVACGLTGKTRIDPVLRQISSDAPVHPKIARLGKQLVKLIRESQDEIAVQLAAEIKDLEASDHPAAKYLLAKQRSRRRHSARSVNRADR